jgi:hypothetical protein
MRIDLSFLVVVLLYRYLDDPSGVNFFREFDGAARYDQAMIRISLGSHEKKNAFPGFIDPVDLPRSTRKNPETLIEEPLSVQ